MLDPGDRRHGDGQKAAGDAKLPGSEIEARDEHAGLRFLSQRYGASACARGALAARRDSFHAMRIMSP